MSELKVKAMNLFLPIILLVILIVGSVYLLNYLSIENASTGMEYKEKLFIEDEVGLIEITTTEGGWEEILENPTAEQYVEATVTINGEMFEHVGLRAKGNSSLSTVANSDSDRYSLKLDFSQYVSDQNYYGLEKINLNNNFSDTTQMKEFISYELMEQMGISTPAHSYVKVTINGEDYALMLAVEELGEAFLTTNYGSTEGYLFKPEDAGSNLVYTSDNPDDYSGVFNNVKVNAETAENHSNIIQMMKEISEGNLDSLNVDQIAKYFALNTALVNMDSYQGNFHHNYYLYETKEGIFSVIPWDYNMSFGGFAGGGGGGKMPTNTQMRESATESSEQNQTNEQMIEREKPTNQGKNNLNISANMMSDSNINLSINNPVTGTTLEESPLLKVILEDEEARSLYDGYLEQIGTTILTEENVQSITTKLKDLLLDEVEADPTKFSTTEQFLEGVSGESSLASFAAKRSESILKQLAGEIEGVSNESGMMNGQGQMPTAPPEWSTDGEMPAAPPEWNSEEGTNSQQSGVQGTPPQMNGQQGQMQGTPPQMNGQQGQMQGTPPQMNGQQGQMQGTPPQMSGQQGQMQGTPPQMSGQQGQTQGTSPEISDQQTPTMESLSNETSDQAKGEDDFSDMELTEEMKEQFSQNFGQDGMPTKPGTSGKGQQTESSAEYYILLVISLVVCLVSILGVIFVSKKKYKRGIKNG